MASTPHAFKYGGRIMCDISCDGFPSFITHRLIKSEDLNHHGTLFAGRTAEWFVESGFVAATSYVKPDRLVCLKIHGLLFTKPARLGDIIRFESRAVYAGRSSIITNIQAAVRRDDFEVLVDGFITFINVDEQTNACPHGIILAPKTPQDRELWQKAKALTGK